MTHLWQTEKMTLFAQGSVGSCDTYCFLINDTMLLQRRVWLHKCLVKQNIILWGQHY